MKNAIRVTGLSKRFGSFTAVDGVDMVIPAGKVFGFLGPNGSGKTTALRMMCGLLRPSEGEIEVLGMRLPEKTEEIRRRVGYMTQKFSLYGDLSVYQNMLFMARIMGVKGRGRKQRINQLLQRFHLGDLASRRAGSLSGGQKRRLALAAAVIHEPRLLLLDEPTSEVDPNTRREFWDELFVMCEAGTTILVTTHLMDEAERCHHLVIINEGCKVADGTPDELKASLQGRLFQVEGGEILKIRRMLGACSDIVATTQVGLSLRVILHPSVEGGEELLKELLGDRETTFSSTAPSIEDVFVLATKKNEGNNG